MSASCKGTTGKINPGCSVQFVPTVLPEQTPGLGASSPALETGFPHLLYEADRHGQQVPIDKELNKLL